MEDIIQELCLEAGSPDSASILLDKIDKGVFTALPVANKGVVYYHLVGGYIEPHFGVLRRYWGDILPEAFSVVEQIKLSHPGRKIRSFIPVGNKLAISFMKRLGFKCELGLWVPTYGDCIMCEEI